MVEYALLIALMALLGLGGFSLAGASLRGALSGATAAFQAPTTSLDTTSQEATTSTYSTTTTTTTTKKKKKSG